jgi:hypothetical protein
MNRSELERLANEHGVSPSAHSPGGGLPNEQYLLDQSARGWSVYRERGLRSSERHFTVAKEACRHLLGLVLTGLSTGRYQHDLQDWARPRS